LRRLHLKVIILVNENLSIPHGEVMPTTKMMPLALKKEDVQLVILDGRRPSDYPKHYDLAYAHWNQIWGEHFKERDGLEKIFSDSFTKQDEISAFFYKDMCIAALCTRAVDLGHQAFLDDSYFELWDKKSIEALTKDGNQVAICGHFSIIPDCPKFVEGVKIREVMIYMTVSHLMRCGFNAISGVARKDKGMHKSFTLFGAETIKSDLVLHNGFVDLIAFYKGCPRTNDPKVAEVSNYIWNNKIGQTQILEKSFIRKVA
jgi:hypothetical protein